MDSFTCFYLYCTSEFWLQILASKSNRFKSQMIVSDILYLLYHNYNIIIDLLCAKELQSNVMFTTEQLRRQTNALAALCGHNILWLINNFLSLHCTCVKLISFQLMHQD